MSIASEISRISAARNDILTSISNKGVTVPATATLSSCPGLINSIVTGGGESVPDWFPKNRNFFTDCTGEISYNFTATQKINYSTTLTSDTANVVWNDGTWSHGGDLGFAIEDTNSAWARGTSPARQADNATSPS